MSDLVLVQFSQLLTSMFGFNKENQFQNFHPHSMTFFKYTLPFQELQLLIIVILFLGILLVFIFYSIILAKFYIQKKKLQSLQKEIPLNTNPPKIVFSKLLFNSLNIRIESRREKEPAKLINIRSNLENENFYEFKCREIQTNRTTGTRLVISKRWVYNSNKRQKDIVFCIGLKILYVLSF